ncbi:SDR family NAD(P)-dependent oxidoreductase [Agarivorans sp. B2Z047]|uniref:SDR family oxidoreductase n=1 Tax=Agarivorans sp. B2Z047 TaxID=2652721 RepID=UPI00128DF7EE|nr:SDR family oxidoreductase [Agarivorans sp. B2Z047]MPW29493.1 SDR family NAD(P)-dependent oxidoreductase [Agarivorans sp. B2Z047]UQN45082.1 SDR family oxidoreductase [Agarivorans sp. B2Z047]
MKTKQFTTKAWTPKQIGSLAGKTYVITGANSGAGFEGSRILQSKGAKVVMLNRNPVKSVVAIEELKAQLGSNIELSWIQMDLAELDSVRRAAKQLLECTSSIEALICNGAIAQVAKQQFTKDGFESQLGVNHFGHFLLCGLLFERIEASQGRIVIVGSNAYKMGLKKIQFDDLNFDANYTAWNSYAQSKLAQMMFGYELQRRIKASGKQVQIHVCHPGASRTNLLKDTASTFNKILWALLSRLIAQSAEKGAWPEVMCATKQGLAINKLYGPTKRADTVGPVGECLLDEVALDQQIAQHLWQLSEENTSFNWKL